MPLLEWACGRDAFGGREGDRHLAGNQRPRTQPEHERRRLPGLHRQDAETPFGLHLRRAAPRCGPDPAVPGRQWHRPRTAPGQNPPGFRMRHWWPSAAGMINRRGRYGPALHPICHFRNHARGDLRRACPQPGADEPDSRPGTTGGARSLGQGQPVPADRCRAGRAGSSQRRPPRSPYRPRPALAPG